VSSSPASPLDLLSFPTRRSSDLNLASPTLSVYEIKFVKPLASFSGSTLVKYVNNLSIKSCLFFWCSSSSKVIKSSAYRVFNPMRSEEHTSELQSRENLVCRLLLE